MYRARSEDRRCPISIADDRPRSTPDHFHEECGVFGVYGHPDAAALTALGLHALQHRGQEAAGIVAYDGEQFNAHRGLGLVSDNFSSKEVIDRLRGSAAIGHVRYATTGEVALRNVQPLFADFEFGGLAICHNGNLTNSYQLRRQLVRRGSLFQSTSDTEVIVHLIATSLKDTVVDRLIDALRQVAGRLFAGRAVAGRGDRRARPARRAAAGARPARRRLDPRLGDLRARHHRRRFRARRRARRDRHHRRRRRAQRHAVRAPRRAGFCVFEYIYFARPDSVVEGHSVYEARKRIGRELARESHVDADIVVPVPGFRRAGGASAMPQESGLPFELGIIRNHYVGRTFIEPTDQIRHLGVRLKHNANRADLEGKRVILVDDSIVRGTTSTKIVEMVRSAGATRGAYAHLEPADDPSLLLRHRDAGARAAARGALTMSRRWRSSSASTASPSSRSTGSTARWAKPRRDRLAPRFCDACFTGDYPIPPTDADDGKVSVQLSLLAAPA